MPQGERLNRTPGAASRATPLAGGGGGVAAVAQSDDRSERGQRRPAEAFRPCDSCDRALQSVRRIARNSPCSAPPVAVSLDRVGDDPGFGIRENGSALPPRSSRRERRGRQGCSERCLRGHCCQWLKQATWMPKRSCDRCHRNCSEVCSDHVSSVDSVATHLRQNPTSNTKWLTLHYTQFSDKLISKSKCHVHLSIIETQNPSLSLTQYTVYIND